MGEKSREKKERKDEVMDLAKEKMGSNGQPILWWVILIGACLALFVPFIVGERYFFPFVGLKSLFFMGITEIIFAAWLVLMVSAPKYRPKINAVTLALGLFLLVFIISSFLGVDFSRSFWSKFERMTGVLMQLHLFAFFLVVSSVFQKKADWLKIFGVSAAAAIFMSLISLAPRIGLDVLGQLGAASRGGATLGNSSFLGTYLLFNLFISLYLFFNTKSALKVFSILAIVVIGIALFFSTAQAALYATIAGLILLFLLWLAFTKKGSLRLVGLFLLTACLLVGLVFAFLATQKNSIVQKEIFDTVGQTFGGRFIVWQGAWEAFLAKPIFGWGPENFEIVFTKYFNPCMFGTNCGGDVWYDRAHNIVFDTLATTGAVGMVSYLGIFIAVFYVLWKNFFRGDIGFWAAGIFSVALAAYFVQNLTVFDMINSYLLFFLILAFAANVSSKRDDLPPMAKPINLSFAAFVLVLLVLSFFNFIIKPAKTDKYIISALGFQPGSAQRLSLYKKTLETSPMGKYQIRDFLGQSDLEFIQSQDLTKIPLAGLKEELDYVVAEMEKSTQESPLDFRSYLKLGQIYDIYAVLKNDAGDLIKAEEILKMAINVSPKNQQGYWALAQTEIYLGKGQEALSFAQKALDLEPHSKQSNVIVIQVAKILGDNDLAQKKYQEAIKIDPSWEAELSAVLNK